MTSVFSYYMLRQSSPGGTDDPTAIGNNLQNAATMHAYFADIRLFFDAPDVLGRADSDLHVHPLGECERTLRHLRGQDRSLLGGLGHGCKNWNRGAAQFVIAAR